MNISNVIFGSLPSHKLEINKTELAQRLGGRDALGLDETKHCLTEFAKIADYRYAYTKAPVSLFDSGELDMGFGIIKSHDLFKFLENSRSAIILAVTTGIATDRLLNKRAVLSPAMHFITDAVASAAAESLCDYVADTVIGKGIKQKRFSIGYGDLSLDIQPSILKLLDAQKVLGITISETMLMTPTKSITAILRGNDE